MSVADPLRGYREEVGFGLAVGDGPFLRQTRQRLSTLALTGAQQTELEHIDTWVIDEILYADELESFLLKDDPEHPLAEWWWHLGALRARTYPADLLPPVLRLIYRVEDRDAQQPDAPDEPSCHGTIVKETWRRL